MVTTPRLLGLPSSWARCHDPGMRTEAGVPVDHERRTRGPLILGDRHPLAQIAHTNGFSSQSRGDGATARAAPSGWRRAPRCSRRR
jgi:hypothetical protein